MRGKGGAALLGLALLALAACGGQAAKRSPTTVTMSDFAFEPNPVRVEGGEGQRVTLTLRNAGASPHNFTVPDLSLASADIPPGHTGTLEFVSTKEGTFRLVCAVPGHEQAGMAGYLTID